ncbi:hypothetical protein EV363DRAFT_698758 [Boletus edulis]|uniref:Secreted protein n=1 Tax=Boletus edulis BED1 TaxID=1328754 RepID=A0AAD4G5N1_BOLED|nr:hypothetical protein EV363DRAFT_698758 [Boletus edulis]KAF8415279.1 hypothetical protein L210DRAFT_2731702 [Boletus edulis BED1]
MGILLGTFIVTLQVSANQRSLDLTNCVRSGLQQRPLHDTTCLLPTYFMAPRHFFTVLNEHRDTGSKPAKKPEPGRENETGH